MPSSRKGAQQPVLPHFREKLHGEREGRQSQREQPRAVPVHVANEKGKAATSGGQRKADHAASAASRYQSHDDTGRSKPSGKEQKSGSRYL